MHPIQVQNINLPSALELFFCCFANPEITLVQANAISVIRPSAKSLKRKSSMP